MISEKMYETYGELKKNWKLISNNSWQDWPPSGFPHERITNTINCIESLESSFTKNLTLLDLACENGLYSIPACSKFKKVIGIDIDDKAIKKAQLTKNHYSAQGLKVNNLEFKVIDFWKYFFNPKYINKDECKWNFHKPEHKSKYKDLLHNSKFSEDKVDGLLACEIFNGIDYNGAELFKLVLKEIKLIIIQSKYLQNEQWKFVHDEYSKFPGNFQNVNNTYHLYSQEGIVSFLEQANYSVSFFNRESNNGLVIGINNDFNIT